MASSVEEEEIVKLLPRKRPRKSPNPQRVSEMTRLRLLEKLKATLEQRNGEAEKESANELKAREVCKKIEQLDTGMECSVGTSGEAAKTTFITICRRHKSTIRCGEHCIPLDGCKVVLDVTTGNFKLIVMHFEVVDSGSVTNFDDEIQLKMMLAKLSPRSGFEACHGFSEECVTSLGYTSTRVELLRWPFTRVVAKNCEKWFRPSARSKQEPGKNVCCNCIQVQTYLRKLVRNKERKGNDDTNPSSRTKICALSPNCQRKRVENLRKNLHYWRSIAMKKRKRKHDK